ncbi:DUF4476 domain-containing protein [Flavobacterium silvaticum]|uniref:DUF4476 domain-containing protein n=1 Tax=Flavobacterium silvaticum TaxID=1852020 RepID=A0A972FNU9_9FLAO|nr:DUF4476 domain-containing protein [Flavobacterium silvaticum]NMH28675.1 DUF4476 domain-containing protein [Flavobacterium silvaticum]
MNKLFFFACTFIMALSASAQNYGHLTIFSEDGDKFTLILNGETINDAPQTNLRVEELNQPYYNARIVFADANKTELSKTIQITDVDDIYKDVTYKIKRDKNNSKKMKLSYFSETAVRPDFIPPSNVKVIHYGQPQVVTQSTTIINNNAPTINTNMNVQGMGVGINVNISEPAMVETHTTTTTTTTSGGYETVESTADCSRNRGMKPTDFNGAISSLNQQKFEDSKLKMAKQIAGSNCLSSEQIKQVCKTFTFEESKLDFAKFAYSRCIDPQSYYKINDIFTYSSSTDELTDFVSGH